MKRAADARNVVVVAVVGIGLSIVVVAAAVVDDSCQFVAFAVFVDHNRPDLVSTGDEACGAHSSNRLSHVDFG